MNIYIGDDKIVLNEREREIFIRIFGDLGILEENGDLELSCIRMKDADLLETIKTIVSIKYPVLSRDDFNDNYLLNDGDKRNIITLFEYFAVNVDPITMMSIKAYGCTDNENKYINDRLQGIRETDLYKKAILGYIKENYKYYETRSMEYIKRFVNSGKWKWKCKEKKFKHSIGSGYNTYERKDRVRSGEPSLIMDSTIQYENRSRKFADCKLDIKLLLEKRNIMTNKDGKEIQKRAICINIMVLNNNFEYDKVGEYIIDCSYTATFDEGGKLVITSCDPENRDSYRISCNDFYTLCINKSESMILSILREGLY